MSYLLKALKKAEQERELQAQEHLISKPVIAAASSSLPSAVVWMCSAVLVVTLVKLFMPVANEEIEVLDQVKEDRGLLVAQLPTSFVTKNEVVSDLESLPSENIVEPKPKPTKPIEKRVVELAAVEAPKDKVEVIDVKPETPLELSELSKEVLSQIPSIALESHIYSSAAQFRSVVINGRTFNEGMMINSEVILNSITNKGVVLEVAGRKVALDKGITWVASKNAE